MIKRMAQTGWILVLVMAMWSCGDGAAGLNESYFDGQDQNGGLVMIESNATGVNTKISTKGLPAPFTYSTNAKFSFSCTTPSCTFKCSLDGAAYKSCTSPKSYSGLLPGGRIFMVKATAAGKTDKTPAGYSWVIMQDSWQPTSTTSVNTYGRTVHTAVWAGYQMLIWGGNNGGYMQDGLIYDAATDAWSTMGVTKQPSARDSHAAVWDWSNSVMVVWGGWNGSELGSGSCYYPSTNTWGTISSTNAPSNRRLHSAVDISGPGVIFWGGWNGASTVNTGAIYNPSDNTWTPTSTVNAPEARQSYSLENMGTIVLVWGGWNGSARLNTGGRYTLSTDSWTPMITTNAPTARTEHSSVYCGGNFAVWGGNDGSYANTGGIYNPYVDVWTPMPTANAPSARGRAAIACYTEFDKNMVIVWGGFDGANRLNSGGRYLINTGEWTDTTSIGAPSPREYATAVFDGGPNQMIIWGGYDGTNYLYTGGRYTP